VGAVGLRAGQQTVDWPQVCDCYGLHFLPPNKHCNWDAEYLLKDQLVSVVWWDWSMHPARY
jgi:hypothetical protein